MAGRSDSSFTTAIAMGAFAAGTFCTGLALSALHLNPLRIEVASYSEMIASLLGAIVGGAVSIAGTYFFHRAELNRADKARGFNILHSASIMYSEITNILGDIERHVEAGQKTFEPGTPKWAMIKPNAYSHIPRQFLPEDLAIFFVMKEYDLHGNLVQLEMFRNSLSEAWATFCASRRELKSIMNVENINNGVVSSIIDLRKNPEARLRILELESLIDAILESGNEFADLGRKTVTSLGV